MSKSGLMLSILALATLVVAPLQAGTRCWNNTGTDWGTPLNWSGSVVPATTDAAAFGPGVQGTQPTLGSPASVGQVVFLSGATNFNITGATLTFKSTGTGATTTNGTGSAILGLNDTYSTNTISANLVLGAAASSTQTIDQEGNNGKSTYGNLILSGNISDGGNNVAVSLTGVGTITLLGSNTFGGGLTFANPTLEIGNANAIPTAGIFTMNGGALRSYDGTQRTIVNTAQFSGTANFGRNAVTSGNGNLVFTNTGTLTGNFTVNPYPNSTSAGLAVCAVAFEGPIGENAAGRTLTIAGQYDAYGYTFLLGTNSYSGRTIIGNVSRSGPVVINSIKNVGGGASSLGAPANTANGTIGLAPGANGGGASLVPIAILRYIGGPASTDRILEFGTNCVNNTVASLDASGTGAVVWTANLAVGGTQTGAKLLLLDGTSSDSNTFAGATSNFPAAKLPVTKQGTGTWVLQGANTFTGGVTLSAGRLVLDYTNNATILDPANNLTLGGGTLALLAKGGTASAQTLGNLTINASTRNGIELLPNGGGSSMTLTLGNTWTRGNANGALYLKVPSGTTLTSSPSVWSGTYSTNGLLVYAVVEDATGIGFATTNGAGNMARYTNAVPLQAASNDGTKNFSLTGSLSRTVTANADVYTLAIDTTGGGTLNLNGYGIQLRAVLFTGTGGYVVTNGSFYQGSADVFYHQYSSGLVTMWSDANGNWSGATVTKSGPGTLVLKTKSAGNNWGGALSVLEGAVRVDFTNTWANNVVLNGGGVLELGAAGDFTNGLGTGNNQVQILGDGGFGAFGATRAVRLNNGTASIDWNTTSFVPNNNALVLSGKGSDSMVDFQNGLNFGNQQRMVRVNDGSAVVDARLSGVLSGKYGGGLIKDGAGTLELTAANTYAGDTWVRAGTLKVNNGSGSGTGNGAVTVFSGAAIGGTGAVNRLNIAGGSLLVDVTGGSVTNLTVTGALNIAAGSTVQFVGSGLTGGPYILARYGSLSGSFGTNIVNAAKYTISYSYQNGTAIALVPRPPAGTVMLFR